MSKKDDELDIFEAPKSLRQMELALYIPDPEDDDDPEEDYDEWPYDKELDFNDPPFTPDEEQYHD